MFGVDWDGDNEESLADDMLTMSMMDDGMEEAEIVTDTGTASEPGLVGIVAVIAAVVGFLLMIAFVLIGILSW